jgi:hypothetical protein
MVTERELFESADTKAILRAIMKDKLLPVTQIHTIPTNAHFRCYVFHS